MVQCSQERKRGTGAQITHKVRGYIEQGVSVLIVLVTLAFGRAVLSPREKVSCRNIALKTFHNRKIWGPLFSITGPSQRIQAKSWQKFHRREQLQLQNEIRREECQFPRRRGRGDTTFGVSTKMFGFRGTNNANKIGICTTQTCDTRKWPQPWYIHREQSLATSGRTWFDVAAKKFRSGPFKFCGVISTKSENTKC